ncbi:hypothetical protein ANRL1_03166 [Anaerolineae bacterium]|nr:hypothetical protein ANRL1_03166 [Anaerolineae bacterium]
MSPKLQRFIKGVLPLLRADKLKFNRNGSATVTYRIYPDETTSFVRDVIKDNLPDAKIQTRERKPKGDFDYLTITFTHPEI